jgi:hypothetical protein
MFHWPTPGQCPLFLSFNVVAGPGTTETGDLIAEVLWLDATDSQIGPPGLDLFIPSLTLTVQGNYLSYLDITGPAPTGA